MSRSRKKIKIYKDSGRKYNYNKRYRVNVKQQLKVDLVEKELDEIGTLPEQKETTNSYDICDWKFFTDDEKSLRK